MQGIEVDALDGTQLDTVQTALGIKANTSAISAETARAINEEHSLSEAIATETTRAEEAEENLNTLIGNLSTEVEKKQTGGIYSSLTAAGISYSALDGPNSLINAIPSGSDLWTQCNNSNAQELNAKNVIPIPNGGVLHVVNTISAGRCCMEYFGDNGNHYHYETSNSSTATGIWYVDTAVPVN